MAVVRLGDGGLLIHSPAPLDGALRSRLDELGPVRFVVPASLLHGHLYMEQYAAGYPEVRLFAAPGLQRRRKDLRFAGEVGADPDPAWAADVDQTTFDGHRLITEVVFLHRSSGTLIVGDVLWHVTPAMPFTGRLWGGWRQGVRPTPAFRLGIRDRAAARASVDRILAWDFDRIVIGHGEMVESGGHEVFERTYGWL